MRLNSVPRSYGAVPTFSLYAAQFLLQLSQIHPKVRSIRRNERSPRHETLDRGDGPGVSSAANVAGARSWRWRGGSSTRRGSRSRGLGSPRTGSPSKRPRWSRPAGSDRRRRPVLARSQALRPRHGRDGHRCRPAASGAWRSSPPKGRAGRSRSRRRRWSRSGAGSPARNRASRRARRTRRCSSTPAISGWLPAARAPRRSR